MHFFFFRLKWISKRQIPIGFSIFDRGFSTLRILPEGAGKAKTTGGFSRSYSTQSRRGCSFLKSSQRAFVSRSYFFFCPSFDFHLVLRCSCLSTFICHIFSDSAFFLFFISFLQVSISFFLSGCVSLIRASTNRVFPFFSCFFFRAAILSKDKKKICQFQRVIILSMKPSSPHKAF